MNNEEQLRKLLARDILQIQVGEKLPTVREIAKTNDANIATVQFALSNLEKAGAITVERRGRLGSFLVDRSVNQLWAVADGGPLVIAFPLPSTRICEGLATGTTAAIRNAGIDAYLIFLRGSRKRLKALHEKRCHAIVISRFAANEMGGPEDQVVFELPANTYVQEHRVYMADRLEASKTGPIKVAIDRDSADLQKLAEMEFRDAEVEFVPTTYLNYSRILEDGKVDAAIWDVDETVERLSPFIQSRPLSAHVLKEIGDSNTSAVFVSRKNDVAVHAVIKYCLANPVLLQYQRDVLAGKLVPEY